MKTLFLCFALLLSLSALGSPFLVCDPYPASGAVPTAFVVTISGVTAPLVTPAVAVQVVKLTPEPIESVRERRHNSRDADTSN